MSLRLYSCLALPLLLILFELYFILRREKLFSESLIAKFGGTLVCAGSAFFALFGTENPGSSKLFLVFFLLCAAADVLLELHFLVGMGLFGAAHICLIIALWQAYPPTVWTLVLWAAALLAAAFVFRRELPHMGMVALPSILYVALLSGTLALGVTSLFRPGGLAAWPLALGALCFFISDLMVAKQEFSGLPSSYQKPVMVLYWAALYLIAAVCW